jgi:hypothetical protein
VPQVVQCLSSKYEALSSTPSTDPLLPLKKSTDFVAIRLECLLPIMSKGQVSEPPALVSSSLKRTWLYDCLGELSGVLVEITCKMQVHISWESDCELVTYHCFSSRTMFLKV